MEYYFDMIKNYLNSYEKETLLFAITVFLSVLLLPKTLGAFIALASFLYGKRNV